MLHNNEALNLVVSSRNESPAPCNVPRVSSEWTRRKMLLMTRKVHGHFHRVLHSVSRPSTTKMGRRISTRTRTILYCRSRERRTHPEGCRFSESRHGALADADNLTAGHSRESTAGCLRQHGAFDACCFVFVFNACCDTSLLLRILFFFIFMREWFVCDADPPPPSAIA